MRKPRPIATSARAVGAFLAALGSLGCASTVETAEERRAVRERVINGNDDRREWYDVAADEVRARLGASVAALMWAHRIDYGDPSLLAALSAFETLGLCLDERFADQPSAAFCSATLIDDELVLTAGHCLGTNSEEARQKCRELLVVFDYHYAAEGVLALDAGDVYACRRVAHYEHRDTENTFRDFAVLELDRRVTADREPATLALDPARAGEALVAASHGAGLPLKVDLGGSVVEVPPDAEHFVASTDSFAGGSGSPLFDDRLELVGYQVRGLSDWSAAGDCLRATHADVPNEQHQLVDSAISALCDSGWPSDRLCGRPHEVSGGIAGSPGGEGAPVPTNAGCGITRRHPGGPRPFTWLPQLMFGVAALSARCRRSSGYGRGKMHRERHQ